MRGRDQTLHTWQPPLGKVDGSSGIAARVSLLARLDSINARGRAAPNRSETAAGGPDEDESGDRHTRTSMGDSSSIVLTGMPYRAPDGQPPGFISRSVLLRARTPPVTFSVGGPCSSDVRPVQIIRGQQVFDVPTGQD
jgi:hypothetical protein